MIRFRAHAWLDYRRLQTALARAEKRGVARVAAAIRLTAVRSIRASRVASAPGRPPHTRYGRLRRAILYALLEEDGYPGAIIGPSFDLFGLAGKAHEFGGKFRKEYYPKRPFMRPALQSVIANQLPDIFRNSVGKS